MPDFNYRDSYTLPVGCQLPYKCSFFHLLLSHSLSSSGSIIRNIYWKAKSFTVYLETKVNYKRHFTNLGWQYCLAYAHPYCIVLRQREKDLKTAEKRTFMWQCSLFAPAQAVLFSDKDVIKISKKQNWMVIYHLLHSCRLFCMVFISWPIIRGLYSLEMKSKNPDCLWLCIAAVGCHVYAFILIDTHWQ